jgi:hypothetical protein
MGRRAQGRARFKGDIRQPPALHRSLPQARLGPGLRRETVHTEPGERRLQRQSPQFPEHRVHLAVHEEHGQIARL